MRRCRGLFRPSDAFFRLQFSADYTITMFGFDFRQGHVLERLDGNPITIQGDAIERAAALCHQEACFAEVPQAVRQFQRA